VTAHAKPPGMPRSGWRTGEHQSLVFPGGARHPPGLTVEDTARLRNRSRVHLARGHRRLWQLLWLLAGPGGLAMLGKNDGPSMRIRDSLRQARAAFR
jgi:hypothetical protein